MHTKGLKTRINYNDFCAWLGNAIEPTETFIFRHDSKKNPQFEVNLRRSVEKREPNQREVSSIITSKNLKEKLVQRTFSQHATLKSVFDDWRNPAENYVQFPRFLELMTFWGFIATET